MTKKQYNGEEPYFSFSAALRIMGAGEMHDELTCELGEPSTMTRHGSPLKSNPVRKALKDLWMLESPLPESSSISDHLRWLNNQLLGHYDYIRNLVKKGVQVDIFCGYRSDCDHAGFAIEPEAARLVADLGVKMEISIIIA
jgi:hypothetical protein